MSLRSYLAGRTGKPNYNIYVPDPDRALVEKASGGKNTVIYDDLGQPSIMVLVDPFNCQDLAGDYGAGLHPAFEPGKEYWVGKYLASMANGRAVSLPGRDLAAVIDFDNAMAACRAKGGGWDLLPNSLWAALAIKSHDDGTMPHGNNRYGKDYQYPTEHGIRQDWDVPGLTSGTARTLTGSGPLAWSHDGTKFGIRDLNGNVWEWVSGMRLQDGEIQIIPVPWAADHGTASSAWQATMEDGSTVAPGTADTLKYDATNADGSGSIRINVVVANQSDGTTYAYEQAELITASSGVTIPDLLRQLALAPGAAGLQADRMYMRNLSERLLFRGGNWSGTTNAGVFAGNLVNSRSAANTFFGFRPAFVSAV